MRKCLSSIQLHIGLSILVLLLSCSQESFVAGTITEGETTNAQTLSSTIPNKISPEDAQLVLENKKTHCSNGELIRPKVDFLIVWDNSGSTNPISASVKKSLSDVIQTISTRFDYRIVTAPMLAPVSLETLKTNSALKLQDFNTFSLITNTPTDLKVDGNINPFNIMVGFNEANILNSDGIGSTGEKGFARVVYIVEELLLGTQIFRKGANTIIVVISNEDDDDFPSGTINSGQNAGDISPHITTLSSVKSQLESRMFRFMTIVPHTPICPPDRGTLTRVGTRYKKMSSHFLAQAQAQGADDDQGQISQDSYDLCSINFSSIFSGINESIKGITFNFVYGFWKIDHADTTPIDPRDIIAYKVSDPGNIFPQLSAPDPSANGFYLIPGVQKVNSRIGRINKDTGIFQTDTGDEIEGRILQLFGSAQVVFPDCLAVITRSPREYFGYASADRNPNVDQLEVFINDQLIPRGGPNGWEFIGFQKSFNIKVKGPDNPSNPYAPADPPKLETGYIIKLNGTSIMTNNQNITLRYKPAPI